MRRSLPLAALAMLCGCTCMRLQDQIRAGFFTYGIPQKCIAQEWGRPARTWATECEFAGERKKVASWEGGAAQAKEYTSAVCEGWEYPQRDMKFLFDVRNRRLVSWGPLTSAATPAAADR